MKQQKAVKDTNSQSEDELFINVPGLCEFEKQFIKNLFTDFSTVRTADVKSYLLKMKNNSIIRQALIDCVLAKL